MFGILAGIGAGVGLLSSIFQNNKEKKQIEQQKKAAWQQYEAGKAYSDKQYAIQEGNAAETLANQKFRLNQSVAAGVDQFNTGLLGQAYGIQNAQIQTASSVGSSLVAEGMGGTRGNSANGLMRAYEERSLERNIDLQNQQNSQTIGGIASQAASANQDITRERASWDQGGYRYEMKQAQDEYNLEMANIGQSNFDWSKSQVQSALPSDMFTGMFSGASSGLSLGSTINSFNNLGG